MNDLAWRKFPVNTIRNEDLDYIAFLMPQELQTAPFMFYMTAICKCDDDGVFDIEDGVIFARLMRIPNRPEVVYEIAKYMTQRRILTQVIPGSSIFMITDWDAPDRRGVVKTKSAEERRAIIAQKIEAERKQRLQSPAPSAHPASSIQINPHSTIPQAAMPAELWQPTEPAPIVPSPAPSVMPSPVVNFEEVRAQTASESAFFCPDFDKNAQNVEKTERERDRERDTEEIKESKRETHTEETEDMRGEASTACGPLEGPTAALAEETRQEAEKEPEKKFPDVADAELTGKLADEAIGKVCENRDASPMPEELAPLIVIANDFFVRNSLIYDAKYDMESIKKLADRCARLKTAKNPAEVVLKTILRQFKIRATTKGDYFFGCKITPQYLLTENTWHHMLQQCSALLLTNRKEEAEWQFQMSTKNPEDQRAIYDDMENQCIKYGIDPNDPRRAGKLMIAMQTASEAVKDTG